jgi:hypothetical protein
MKSAQAICSRCGAERLAVRPTPSHALHAILTLLLCGLWVVPWAAVTVLSAAGWRCAHCGARVSTGAGPLIRQLAVAAAVAAAAVAGWVLLLALFGRLPTRF